MSNTQESYPTQTTGLGVAAKIAVAGNLAGGTTVPGYNDVTLSLSGATYGGVTYPETFQLNPNLEDVSGAEITPGTSYTLTAVANSSGNTAVYTGTIVATANSLAGQTFVVAGFVTHTSNNGTFIATANNGTTTITLENASAVAETHAATAVSQEAGTNELTYVNYGFKTLTGNTYQPSGTATAVATVSATGLLTAVAVGQTVVEVSYPAFNNSVGDVVSSGNIMNGLPINKIYAEINVQVLI
jgi:hypothetical protein